LALDNLVIYQIFPDRFNNKDNHKPQYKTWSEKPTRWNHFGGNLKGIEEKVPYLKSLGINCIYLTPIFEACSPHKYDTKDYMKIDPNFGSMQDFQDLLETLHNNNIQLILDGVFNHTGDHFWAFEDCEMNGKKSRYWDWYRISDYPIRRFPKPNYENAGIYYLPKFNHNNSEVVSYVKQVVRFWSLMGIDGWRFDMSWCMNPEFWSEITTEARRINQNILFIGEYWDNPSNMLREYPFDGTMDYIFRTNVIDLLKGKIKPDLFSRNLSYKSDMRFVKCWNMLGSHDTSRIRGIFHNDEKLRMAFTLMFTFPGTPVIYYGDEIGMFGGKDPDCRRTFNWNEKTWNLEIYDHVKNLCDFRRDIGNIESFQFLKSSGSKLSYLIESQSKSYVVNVNLDECSTNIGG